MWKSPGEAQECWAGQRVQKFCSRPGPDKKMRVKFHLLFDNLDLHQILASQAAPVLPSLLQDPTHWCWRSQTWYGLGVGLVVLFSGGAWLGGGSSGVWWTSACAWKDRRWAYPLILLFGFCAWLCLAWSAWMVWAFLHASPRAVSFCYSADGLSFCRKVGDPVCFGWRFCECAVLWCFPAMVQFYHLLEADIWCRFL